MTDPLPRHYCFGCCTDWWLIDKDSKRILGPNRACFGGARWQEGVGGFDYHCYVHPNVTEEHIRFWTRFLSHMFEGDLVWSWTMITNGKSIVERPVEVHYHIDGPLPNDYNKCLLYASAFRYLDEHSNVVLAMFARRAEAENPEGMFKLFQDVAGKVSTGGHDIYSSYRGYGYSAPTTAFISLETFRANLKKGGRDSVYSYFRR